MKKIKVGVVGLGNFSGDFIDLFNTHPDVAEVAVCDLLPERIKETCERWGVTRSFSSFDEMIAAPDIDCVAIFTQRHLHGPMVLKALDAGKHVYSAVPIACTVEEIEKIIEKVKETRLVYMMGETCYYYPCAIYCREKYRLGHFGKFVYGESQYYHDMFEMADAFKTSGGENWQWGAGIPPMYYPTHSIAMLFSAIGEHATKVSCMGFRDDCHDDNVYGEGKNAWDNPFANETAIFQMSGGGVARINEFRRVGINFPSSYITCLYGDEGAYERSITQHTFQRGKVTGQHYVEYLDNFLNNIHFTADKKRGGPVYVERAEDLYTLKEVPKLPAGEYNGYIMPISPKYVNKVSPVQDLSRLPASFRDVKAPWHHYSHPFLIDDFVRAVVDDKLPPNNAWDSARYMIPGLIAHESALRGGELMDIPDFGEAPADWERLTFEPKDYYEEGPENAKKSF